MSSILNSQGMVLVTAMAVSGTVILLAFRLQKSIIKTQFPISQVSQPSPPQVLRSCIPSEKKRGGMVKKKTKRVHFAEDVVDPSGDGEEFRRRLKSRASVIIGSKCSSSLNSSPKFKKIGGVKDRGMPENRVALYRGILRDRGLHRMACY